MYGSAARLASVIVLMLTMGKTAMANDAPVVREALTAQLPYPYDETADAHAALESALKRAVAEHKFVLLDFGGNWCPDCRVTAGVMALADVKPWIDRTFETVFIDIGRLNKNLDIGERYGQNIKAVPTMIILDSQGRVLNAGNPAALSNARDMSPQSIVDTIYGWTQHSG